MNESKPVSQYVICEHCGKQTLPRYYKKKAYPLCGEGFREWVKGGDLLSEGIGKNAG